LLKAEQCDEAQGYLFGRAQANVEIGEKVQRRAS